MIWTLAIVVLLVGANAQKDAPTPCSKQMELEHRCMLTVETSPEAEMIKGRMKQAVKTCAPDYPEECHAKFDAAHECATSIHKNADSDPTFQETKSQSQPAIDECFAKYPPNVKEGVMEIFMNMKHGPKKFHKKWRHHRRFNATGSGESSAESSGETSGETSGENASVESGESSSNETSSSFERRHHGGGGRHGGGGHGGRGRHGRGCHHHRRHHGGRHHGPRNFTDSSSASASGEKSGSGSSSKEWKHGDEKCRKTREQHKCVMEEFKKLGNDTSFVDVMNTLIRQKLKCKQLVDWSCQVKGCPKRAKCIFKATKPCRQAFMEKMKTCLADKGFTLPPFMMRHEPTTAIFEATTPVPDLDSSPIPEETDMD